MQYAEKRASFSLEEMSLSSPSMRTLSIRHIEKSDSISLEKRTLSLYSFYQEERFLLSREERDFLHLEKKSLFIVSIHEKRFPILIEEESL